MAVTRSDILTNAAARDAYIKGVTRLKKELLSPNGLSTYDTFVTWHHQAMMKMTPPTQNERNSAHRGPIFLPWHRHMLMQLENHLQRVLQDATFALPYWNWGADGDQPSNQQPQSPLWAANCMGGDGDPVATGPFTLHNWPVVVESTSTGNLRSTNRGLRRGIGNGVDLPTSQDVKTAVANSTYDVSPWDGTEVNSFRNQLEGWQPDPPQLHNLVHVWVGGDMGISTSPNDPVFFLNHCNVDRIWSAWQAKNPGSHYEPQQNTPGAPIGHRENDKLNTFLNPKPTPADLLDVSSVYAYDTITDIL